jgi:acetylornithine/succinyldiaminopimelate/putrescine aminotransferase
MITKYKNGRIRATGKDADAIFRALRGDDRVELFNKTYTTGDKVIVKDDNGNEFTDVVKAPASIMGGHTAVAWLEDKGSYLLERVIRKAE